MFKNIIYSYDGKAEFSAVINPVFSVTRSFGAQKNISNYQCLNVVLLNFVYGSWWIFFFLKKSIYLKFL